MSKLSQLWYVAALTGSSSVKSHISTSSSATGAGTAIIAWVGEGGMTSAAGASKESREKSGARKKASSSDGSSGFDTKSGSRTSMSGTY